MSLACESSYHELWAREWRQLNTCELEQTQARTFRIRRWSRQPRLRYVREWPSSIIYLAQYQMDIMDIISVLNLQVVRERTTTRIRCKFLSIMIECSLTIFRALYADSNWPIEVRLTSRLHCKRTGLVDFVWLNHFLLVCVNANHEQLTKGT